MTRIRPLVFLAAAGLAAWAAHGPAVQPAPIRATPVPRPAFLDPEPYTAFPDVTVVTFDSPDYRGPDGKPLKVPVLDSTFGRLKAVLARPVPADAPPLTKVRLAQVYEGTEYLYRFQEKMRLGSYLPSDYQTYHRMAAEVFRAAAEVEDDPAGKVALYEDRVRMMKEAERFATARTNAGTDPPHALNEARFHRLQAEADLLRLKEELAAAAGPQQVYCVPTGPTRGGILRRR
jgi:hypothetical protein